MYVEEKLVGKMLKKFLNISLFLGFGGTNQRSILKQNILMTYEFSERSDWSVTFICPSKEIMTDRPTNQSTGGHKVSLGSYTSKNINILHFSLSANYKFHMCNMYMLY